MGASARIVAAVLLLSAAIAVPTGDPKHHALKGKTALTSQYGFPVFGRSHGTDDPVDLSAESSEVIPEAVATPSFHPSHHDPHATNTGLTDHSIELVGGSQTFFPSFANLFEPRQHSNNYRLNLGNPEAAYSQRPNSYRSLLNYPLFGNYRNLDSYSGKQNAPAAAAAPGPVVDSTSGSILGSGNFGIIRGGTFLAQNDEESDFEDSFSSFYNNGHGRPSSGVGYIANPRPNYSQDQFANFRDFADINSPSNSAYSHFVVVYANKNATMDEVGEETRRVVSEPKNIFETLQLLDKSGTTGVKPPKISKAKAKLAATKGKLVVKKEQWKKSNSKSLSSKHDPEEPLLALS